jgi:hypothetical protein
MIFQEFNIENVTLLQAVRMDVRSCVATMDISAALLLRSSTANVDLFGAVKCSAASAQKSEKFTLVVDGFYDGSSRYLTTSTYKSLRKFSLSKTSQNLKSNSLGTLSC